MSPSDKPDAAPMPTADLPEASDDLASRARAWWHTRDPRTLWPGLEPSFLQPSADAIGHAAASLLRGRSTTLGSAGGHDAYAIGIAALLTGTGPLLGSWVAEGSLDVGDALAKILAQHLSHSRARVGRMTRGVTPVLTALAAAGVTPAVIKGFHTAHVYFAEPGLRPISDVDVVVPPDRIPQAEEILRNIGFKPSSIISRPYRRDWYPADDNDRIWSFELFDARDRWKVDLHDGASFGDLPLFGFALDRGPIFGAEWEVEGAAVRVPTQPALTIILAAHLSAELRPKRLLRLVELALVIRRDREIARLDWDGFEAMLEESGGRRFVYPALALVERLSPGTIDSAVLGRARRDSSRLARWVTDRFTPTAPVLDGQFTVAERLMYAASGRDVIRWLGQWINPLPGRRWRDSAAVYHSRVRRLVSGRASWIVGRGRS